MAYQLATDRIGDSQWARNQPRTDGLTECAVALRNQLASVSSNNALEFLANVRKVREPFFFCITISVVGATRNISENRFPSAVRYHCALQIAREIDVEANVVSEELAIIEESYPQILSSLRRFKRDLLLLKEETCALRNQYENFVSTFMDLMQKSCPTLVPQLQALSRKQALLRRLKWANRGRDLLSLCRNKMKSSHCDWTRLSEHFQNACKHMQERVEFTDNSYTTFADGLKALALELNEFARKGLNEVLCAIKYPFEDSTDTQAYANEITAVASILYLIYLIEEYIQKGTGCDEIYRALLDPIGLRFTYHFCGDRKTNDVWKPQWYLSQTLNWIHVNLGFFVATISGATKQSVSTNML
ncbi:hypothetical protein COOONC_15254, partial [Cooperia oncophora]